MYADPKNTYIAKADGFYDDDENIYEGNPDFDPVDDIILLIKGVDDWDTRKEGIIKMLTNRNRKQRHIIGVMFGAVYQKTSLPKKLGEISSGGIHNLLVEISMPEQVTDARTLKKLYDRMDSSKPKKDAFEHAVADIICIASPSYIQLLKGQFRNEYNCSLSTLFETKSSEIALQNRLILALLWPNSRQSNTGHHPFDNCKSCFEKVESDCVFLFESFSKHEWHIVIGVFACRPFNHIKEVNRVFKEKYKASIDETMKKNKYSSSLRRYISTISMYAHNPYVYYAYQIRKLVKAKDLKEDRTIRVAIKASDLNRQTLRREFRKLYDRRLTTQFSKFSPDLAVALSGLFVSDESEDYGGESSEGEGGYTAYVNVATPYEDYYDEFL